MIRNSWYVADFGRNFKFELQKKVITGLPIVMWRTQEGEVVAFDGRCPHKGFPLWESNLLADGTLQCGYHGFCFSGSGKCTDVPSQRDLPIAPTADLRRYPITEQDGLVWIWPGDPAKAKNVAAPRIPELSSGKYEFVAADPPQKVRANYRLLIENILDITHLYPLHDGNIGNISNSFIPADVIEREHEGNPFVMTIRKVEKYELAPYFKRWFDLDVVDREHTHQMVGPGLIRVDLRIAPPGQLGTDQQRGYIVANCNTPIDENNLEWRWIMITKAGERFPADPTMTLVQGIGPSFRRSRKKMSGLSRSSTRRWNSVPNFPTARSSAKSTCVPTRALSLRGLRCRRWSKPREASYLASPFPIAATRQRRPRRQSEPAGMRRFSNSTPTPPGRTDARRRPPGPGVHAGLAF